MEGKCYNIPEEIMYGRNCFQCFTLLTLESQSLFLCQYLFWVLVTDLLTLKWTGEEPIGYPFIIIGQLANRWGNSRNSAWLYFLGSKITADGDCRHEIKRRLLHGKKKLRLSYDKLRQHIKKTVTLLSNKGLYGQSYGFFSSHVWMWELDYK